ncbi:hypothetical protein K1719_029108 [Acacia pycnantha]|nr:hypothetical protein K1719_029108 [Acacia pycnantha]
MSTSDDKCFKIINQGLPEIEARVLHNQILIRTHCEKHNTVMLTIFAQLKSLHLSIISSSVLTFANFALDITIIAEVEEHKIEVKEVVKKLRLALKENSHNQCNLIFSVIYILSFDKSTIIPVTTDDDNAGYEKHEPANTRASSLKWTPENNHSESKAHQKTRKSRSKPGSSDHIMSERKRKQQLSEKFIALSATIPGLKVR